MSSPVGAAFLVTADAAGMSPQDIVEPPNALHLLGAAADQTNPHEQTFQERVAEARSRGAGLAALARDLMAQPEIHAWWAPLDRDRQVWTSLGPGSASSVATHAWAEIRPGDWNDTSVLVTSTLLEDVTSLDLSWVWDMGTDPVARNDGHVPREQMAVARTARIREVQDPDDWLGLVRDYLLRTDPATIDPERMLRDSGYVQAVSEVRIDPWAAARDWDGIHITFGAALLAGRIACPLPGGGWTWIVAACEHTVWLNREVSSIGPLPNLDATAGAHRFGARGLPTPIEDAVLFPDGTKAGDPA